MNYRSLIRERKRAGKEKSKFGGWGGGKRLRERERARKMVPAMAACLCGRSQRKVSTSLRAGSTTAATQVQHGVLHKSN